MRANKLFSGALGVALLAALTLAPGAGAEQAAVVRLDPAAATVGEGQTAAVTVRVDDVQGLYGLDIRLGFDPAAVEVVDADPATDGVQMRPGELLKADLIVRNTADNAQGTTWFAITQLNPAEPVNGSGVALVVTFRGKQAGATSPLKITYAKLAERAGREIPVTLQEGEIRVVGEAEAPATPTEAPPPAQPTVVLPTTAPASLPTATAPVPATSRPPVAVPQATVTASAGATAEPASPTPQPTVTQATTGEAAISGAMPEPTAGPAAASAASGPSPFLLLAGLAAVALLAGLVWFVRRRARGSA